MYQVCNKSFKHYHAATVYGREKIADWARPGVPCIPVVKDKHYVVAVITSDANGVVVHDLIAHDDDNEMGIGF